MITFEILLIPLLLTWTIFVNPISSDDYQTSAITTTYETWRVSLVDYDIPKGAAITFPMNKTILIEADLYPHDKGHCDVLKHEYLHAMWYKVSNGEGEDHMKMIREGTFC